MKELPDRHAWHDRCFEHERFLKDLALQLTQDESQAADLVQDTWVQAMTRPPQLRSPAQSAPRAWLAKVARNLAISRFRSDSRRREREERTAAREATAQGAGATEGELGALLDRLHVAMGRLDERYSEPLRLRYFEGLSVSEVAVRLELPLETARTRLKRGLQELRGRLDDDLGGRRRWAVVALFGALGGGRTGRSLSLRGWLAVAALVVAVPLVVLAVLGDGSRDAEPAGAALAGGDAAQMELARLVDPGARVPTSSEEAATPDVGQVEAVPAPHPAEAPPAEAPPADGAVRVSGFVRDSRGRPVAGAEVAVHAPEPQAHQVLNTDVRSGADGSFVVEAAGARGWVSARHGAFSSARIALDSPRRPDEPPGERRLDLVLMDPGGTLYGVVLDEHGQPLGDARVATEEMVLTMPSRAFTTDGLRRAPAWERVPPVTSDPDTGAFELHGVRTRWDTGTWLLVHRAGYASTRYLAALNARATVTLRPESVVTGRVRTSSGAPVAGALVTAHVEWADIHFHARTLPNGTFRLAGLGDGPLHVRVRSDEAGLRGAVDETLVLAVGEDREVAFVLGTHGRVAGRLTDEEGEPLAGWQVSVDAENEVERARRYFAFESAPPQRVVRTDERGEFEVFGCAAVEHLVRAFPPREAGEGARAWARGVHPDGPALELTCARKARNARLTGLVGARAEGSADGTELLFFSELEPRVLRTPVGADGAFDVELLPARYELWCWRPGQAPQALEPVKLRPNEHRDLGRLAPRPRGSLVFVLTGVEGGSPESALVELIVPQFVAYERELGGPEREADIVEFDDLPAGTYTARITSDDGSRWEQELRFVPGETDPIEARLTWRSGWEFEVRDHSAERLYTRFSLRAEDAHGRTVAEQHVMSYTDRSAVFQVDLDPGTYRVHASNDLGREGEIRIEVQRGKTWGRWSAITLD